jgi:hypothetical protein
VGVKGHQEERGNSFGRLLYTTLKGFLILTTTLQNESYSMFLVRVRSSGAAKAIGGFGWGQLSFPSSSLSPIILP